MKKKIIIITLISAIISVIIYFYTQNDEVNIVSLGDSLSLGMTPYNIEGYSFNDYLKDDYKKQYKLKDYIYEFAGTNKTIKEQIYEIKENKAINIKNKTIEIQRAINEAHILVIAIGNDELYNVKITNQIKNEFKEDFEELLSMIKMLNHEKVIVLSLYQNQNHDPLSIMKINAIIRDITLSNDFIYLDINHILEPSDFFDQKTQYINYLGHKKIYEELKKVI